MYLVGMLQRGKNLKTDRDMTHCECKQNVVIKMRYKQCHLEMDLMGM